VIFHSYVAVYQRVSIILSEIWPFWWWKHHMWTQQWWWKRTGCHRKFQLMGGLMRRSPSFVHLFPKRQDPPTFFWVVQEKSAQTLPRCQFHEICLLLNFSICNFIILSRFYIIISSFFHVFGCILGLLSFSEDDARLALKALTAPLRLAPWSGHMQGCAVLKGFHIAMVINGLVSGKIYRKP